MATTQPSDSERLQWVLAFVQSDDVETRTEQEVRHAVLRNLWLFPGMGLERADFPKVVREWRQEVQHGLAALETRARWTLHAPPNRGLNRGLILRLERRHDGSIEAVYQIPDLKDGFLNKTVDLLERFGAQLRRCEPAFCRRWFLPDDPRQRYCSPECGRRARWEKFAPSRERDYQAEYERRQRKRTGAKVRIGRRARSS